MIRRVVWFALVIAMTVLGLVLLWQVSGAIMLFCLSLAVAAALRPIVHAVSSKRLTRRTGLIAVYVLLAATIVLGLLAISQPVARDLQNATNDFVAGYENAKTDWPKHGTFFQKMLAEQLPPSQDLYSTLTSQEGIAAVEGVFGLARNFFSLLSYLGIVVMLSLYWSVDQFRFERLVLSTLSTRHHEKALSTWRAVETGVGAFVRSQFLQSMLALIVLGVGYQLIGIRYPVLLALLGAVARLIPWFGLLIALIPGVLIWVGVAPLTGALYIAYTAAVLFLLRRLVESHIANAQRYSSLSILLLIIALAEGVGLIGILFAPILGVTLHILYQELNPAPRGRFSPALVEKTAELMGRATAVRSQIENQDPTESNPVVDQVYLLVQKTREFMRGY